MLRYVTEGTFDAYLYQLIENKQKFISQIMTSRSPARTVEDIDEAVLSYAEIKALATGNPHIKEKMDLDIQVSRLRLLKQNYLSQKYDLEDRISWRYPEEIRKGEKRLAGLEEDMEKVRQCKISGQDDFPGMKIRGAFYRGKGEAGKAILAACQAITSSEPVLLGEYCGLSMELCFRSLEKQFVITLCGRRRYEVPLGNDVFGNITRLDNVLAGLSKKREKEAEELAHVKQQFETAKSELKKPFLQEDELTEKMARLAELNALLELDQKEVLVMEEEPEGMEITEEVERKGGKTCRMLHRSL